MASANFREVSLLAVHKQNVEGATGPCASAVVQTLVLLQVYQLEKTQLSWFYIKLAGYTLMVLVRFDDIMGDAEPSSRIDSLDQFISLSAAVAVTVPLAQFLDFEAAPPVAVAIAGFTYFALHARKDKR